MLPHLWILTTSITTLLLDTETFLISFFVVLTSNVFIEELPVIPVYRSRISNIFIVYCGYSSRSVPFHNYALFLFVAKEIKRFPGLWLNIWSFFQSKTKNSYYLYGRHVNWQIGELQQIIFIRICRDIYFWYMQLWKYSPRVYKTFLNHFLNN